MKGCQSGGYNNITRKITRRYGTGYNFSTSTVSYIDARSCRRGDIDLSRDTTTIHDYEWDTKFFRRIKTLGYCILIFLYRFCLVCCQESDSSQNMTSKVSLGLSLRRHSKLILKSELCALSRLLKLDG
jgi:hypothetical protein